jgi:hypothetical protein
VPGWFSPCISPGSFTLWGQRMQCLGCGCPHVPRIPMVRGWHGKTGLWVIPVSLA